MEHRYQKATWTLTKCLGNIESCFGLECVCLMVHVIWLNITLGTFLKVFLMRLTFESVDWVKQILNRTLSKTIRQTLPWVRKNSFYLTAFELGHRLFLFFRHELKHQHFLGFKVASLQKVLDHLFSWFLGFRLRLELRYWLFWLSSLPAPADLGTSQPP